MKKDEKELLNEVENENENENENYEEEDYDEEDRGYFFPDFRSFLK